MAKAYRKTQIQRGCQFFGPQCVCRSGPIVEHDSRSLTVVEVSANGYVTTRVCAAMTSRLMTSLAEAAAEAETDDAAAVV